MRTKKERNLEYEKKFRSYLFKGDYDRFLEIIKNLNVEPNLKKGLDKNEKNKISKS